jgi:biopolymer transport protein ExbD
MPEAHIRGDVDTPYKCIGGAIFTMQRAGFARIGFISEPPPMAGGRNINRSPLQWQCRQLERITRRKRVPVLDMNVVPLIDVLLVLLIMFIITIPIQTHAVKLDLPQDQTNQPPPPILPTKNKIVITGGGEILWNGTAVSPQQLRLYLDATQQMDPTPELHLQPEPNARYALVDEVLAITKRARVDKMGFVGNEAYGTF